MRIIVKRNIYTNEIVDCWDSLKECAEEMGVKPPTILQSINKHCKCKDYFFGYVYVDRKKILKLIQNEDGQRLH